MASSGTYDAADPNTIDPNRPINPPVMSAFEPGSVQKSITFAAALQQRVITPKTVISVPDQITWAASTVSDAWYHPTERFTATGVLAESSNVGTLKIAQKLGPTPGTATSSASASAPRPASSCPARAAATCRR